MTLVELLISLLLMSGISLMGIQTFQHITNSNKSIETTMNMNVFVSHLNTLLSNPKVCSFNFEGLKVSGRDNIPINQIVSPAFRNANGQSKIIIEKLEESELEEAHSMGLGSKKPFSRNYYVEQMKIEPKKGIQYALIIDFKKSSDKSLGLNRLRRIINLVLSVDDHGEVDSCFVNLRTKSTQAVTSACAELKGRYDENADHCILPKYESGDCRAGEYFSGFILDEVQMLYRKKCIRVQFNHRNCNNFGTFASNYSVNAPGFQCSAMNGGEFSGEFDFSPTTCIGRNKTVGVTLRNSKVKPTCQ